MRKWIEGTIRGLALCAGLVTAGAANAGFSKTEVQLLFGDGFKMGRNANPATGFAEKTHRQTVTLEHFSAGKIGDLFFFVDFFRDTEAGVVNRRESDQYGEIYGHLSGKNLGLDFGESGLVKDLSFGLGLNQGTDFSVGLAGARLNLNVPGFRVLTVGLYAYNNFVDPFDRNLDTTYQATVVWQAPFELGRQKFLAKGVADFIGSQGSGVANQVMFSPQLRWDIGHAMGGKAGKFHLGIEYTHFENKFGLSNVDEDSASVFFAMKF